MPDILDHVAYLSQEIGPRPAGTEEEQQAALYITEQMQKDAGLSAIIEDFSGAPGAEAPRVICCAATLVVTILALFLPAAGVVSIVVTLLAALLFAAEVFNRLLGRNGRIASAQGDRGIALRQRQGERRAQRPAALDSSHPAMGYVRRHGIPASAADRS